MVVSRCQVLIGQCLETSPDAAIAELPALVGHIPKTTTVPEQLVARAVITQLLARLVQISKTEHMNAISPAFFRLVSSMSVEAWRESICDAVRAYVAASSRTRPDPARIGDWRVAQMLRMIETRYSDPSLTLGEIARALALSSSRASRILRKETGHGFLEHLHRQRAAVGREHLLATSLSIKEVSASVGYLHPSQFSRHFRSVFGASPASVRASQQVTATSPRTNRQEISEIVKGFPLSRPR
jgi:AraC-like DNA-binding protein